MSLLIAGSGDLGQTIGQLCQTMPGWQTMPVFALRRHPPNTSSDTHINWIKSDLTIPSALTPVTALANQITHVVYCAAPNERSQADYRATYIDGLKNLVAALKTTPSTPSSQATQATDEPQFLFVSSTAVYDAHATGLIDEDSPTQPQGFNGQIVLEAERWLLANWSQATVLRLSGLYGPTKQSLLRSIEQGRSTMPASDQYWANRIHVEDAARAILHLLSQRYTGVYIGTDSHPMPLRELYSALAQLLNAPTPSEAAPSPMMGTKQLSNKKLLATGFTLKWPNCLEGYQAIIELRKP